MKKQFYLHCKVKNSIVSLAMLRDLPIIFHRTGNS